MKTSREVFAIDANLILRHLLRDHEELSPRAKAVMDAVEAGDIAVSCDPVIFAEVIWVLTSFYKFPKDRIVSSIEPILKSDGFIIQNKDRYLLALDIYANTSAHFGDACACAAAIQDAQGRLFSFDRKLSRVPGIQRLEGHSAR